MLYFSLQKDLFQNESCPIDLEARVFTAETEDIIGQYIIFCRVMDDQVKILGRTQEAAIEAIRICCDRGVLKDYLKEREKEVITIMITLFNQEYATQQYGKAQKEEGRAEGEDELSEALRDLRRQGREADAWKAVEDKQFRTQILEAYRAKRAEATA